MPSPFARSRTHFVAMGLLGFASTAFAQDACEPYEATAFQADLEAVTPLLEAVDIEGSRTALSAIHDRLLCLSVVVPREDFARYARAEATIGFLSQDEDRSLRWGRAAKFADPDGAWPSIIPEGHPVTSLPDDVGPPLWGSPDGKQFAGSRGDAAFANGVFLAQPRLASEVPFLVQRFDKRERAIGAHWQDGAAFPESILEDGDGTNDAPSWFDLASAEPVGLGEAESFSMAVDPPDGTEVEVEVPVVDVPPPPVDDRPIEVRAREAYERAIGIADLNPEAGREDLVEFMEDFGDSGIPEVADAQRWLDRHPAPEVAVVEGPNETDVTPPTEVEVPDRPPRRERPERTGSRGNAGLRTASYIAAGSAVALYGGALGSRAAYNSNPSDGLYYATNGMTAASGGVGAVAAGLFVSSFIVGSSQR